MSERRYNEAELAEILRSAAQSQSQGGSAGSESSGFSLAEIERLAAEVGIDPANVASAADSLSLATTNQKSGFWGAPAIQSIERTVEGALDDASWEEVVAEMRWAYGNAGAVSEVGSSREWSGGSEFCTAHLSATPKNGKTRYRLTVNQHGYVVVGWLITFFVMFIGSIAFGAGLSKSGVMPSVVWGIVLTYIALLSGMANRVMTKHNVKNRKSAEALLTCLKQLTPRETTLAENLSKPVSEAKPMTTDAQEQSS